MGRRCEEILEEILEDGKIVKQPLGIVMGPQGIQTVLVAPGFDSGIGHDTGDLESDHAWTVFEGTYGDDSYAFAVLETYWPEEESGAKVVFDLLSRDSAFAFLTIQAFNGCFALIEGVEEMPEFESPEALAEWAEQQLRGHGVMTFALDVDDPSFQTAMHIATLTIAEDMIPEMAKFVGGAAPMGMPFPTPGGVHDPLASFDGPKH